MFISIDGDVPSKKAHSFQVLKMAQGFFDAGQPVTLVTSLNWTVLKNRLAVRNIYEFYGLKANIPIKRLWVYNLDFFKRSLGGYGYHHKVATYVKSKNPEFMYARAYLTPYHCVLHKIPTIAEIHSVNFKHPDLATLFTLKEDPYFLGIVTIHESIRQKYIEMGVPAQKILVQEDGVDLDNFSISDDRYHWRRILRLSPQKKYVVYAGGLYVEKGIEEILKVAKYLENDESIGFVIVGGRKEEVIEWKAYCKTHDIKNVEWTGFVSNSKVPKYLKAADVLVMPYSLKRKYKVMDIHTTSPLKLFEYMASKRPIVTSNISVVQKVLKHGYSGFLIEPDNIADFAESVRQCLLDRTNSDRIADNAFKEAQQYSWEKRCRNIVSFFGLKGDQ